MASKDNHPGREQLKVVRLLMPHALPLGVLGPIIDPRVGPPVYRYGTLQIFATVQPAADESPWYHVSYSRSDRVPDHDDTCLVRRVFFKPEALVLAVFPPTDEYVNHHQFCLHLWQRIGGARVVPDLRVPGGSIGLTV